MKKLIFLFLFIALGFSQQTGKWDGDSIVFQQNWSQFENPVCFGDSEIIYLGIDTFYIYVDDNLHQLIFDGDGDFRFKKVLSFDDEIHCYGVGSVKAWGDAFYLDWNENGNPFVSFSDADSLWYFRTGKRFTFTSWLQIEDSIKVWDGTDTTKILANKITTDMIGVDDSLWIAQWSSAPATGSSGLFGADTTNDSVIVFLGVDTRAVVYPPLSGMSGSDIIDSLVEYNTGSIVTANKNALIGGDDNCVEGTAANNVIAGGKADTIKNCNESFIGGGEKNYALSAAEVAMVGGLENYIIGANQVFIGGGNLNFVQALRGAIVGGYQDSVKGTYSGIVSGYRNTTWGSYTAICGGSYNDIGSGQNYSFIGAGNANFVDGSYSAIISGYQDTVYAKMSVALGGIRNIIRADDNDSCNVAAGVAAVVDSCLGTFAMNCHIKKADSTFGFSKQIWVIEAGETTKVEAKKIVSSEYEGDSSTIKAWQDVDSMDAIHAVVNTSMVLVNDATFKRGYFTVEQDFDYTSGTAAIITVDDGWIVVDVWCVIKTIFDGTTPDVTVGDAAVNNGIFDADPSKTGWTGGAADERGAYLWDGVSNHTIQKIYETSTVLNVYVTGSLMTQGNGTIYLGIIRL